MHPPFYMSFSTNKISNLSKHSNLPVSRVGALQILSLSCNDKPIQFLLNDYLGKNPVSPADAALITELVYGFLRSKIRLDWLLSFFLDKPHKLPEALRLIIGLALFELLYLDKIPARATVHTAVEISRHLFGDSLSRVTNVVLRSFLRRAPQCHYFDNSFVDAHVSTKSLRLSIRYSIPEWIVRLWLNAYDDSFTEDCCSNSSVLPWIGLRLNSSTSGWNELAASLGGLKLAHSGLLLAPGAHTDLRSLHQDGKLSYQGAGSQQILYELEPHKWPQPIWDVCAGRGGKTLALAEMGINVTLASDISLSRLRGLSADAARLGLIQPQLICSSAIDLPINLTPGTFLLDVPCSGLGTLARHPDLSFIRKPADLPVLVQLQRHILSSCWNRLPIGGFLAYITCTLNPSENEQQILQFLHTHSNSKLLHEWKTPPDGKGSDIMYCALICKL